MRHFRISVLAGTLALAVTTLAQAQPAADQKTKTMPQLKR